MPDGMYLESLGVGPECVRTTRDNLPRLEVTFGGFLQKQNKIFLKKFDKEDKKPFCSTMQNSPIHARLRLAFVNFNLASMTLKPS